MLNNIIGQNKNGFGPYDFSRDNYNTGYCGSGHNLTYSFTQGNSTYDAAMVNMGEHWMMFNHDQGSELINNTYHWWETINGVNGGKFVNKTDDSKYIFLPAAGFWNSRNNSDVSLTAVYNSTDEAIKYDDYVWCLYVNHNNTIIMHDRTSYRTFGVPVRGVRHQP